jgi:hypothetical protein
MLCDAECYLEEAFCGGLSTKLDQKPDVTDGRYHQKVASPAPPKVASKRPIVRSDHRREDDRQQLKHGLSLRHGDAPSLPFSFIARLRHNQNAASGAESLAAPRTNSSRRAKISMVSSTERCVPGETRQSTTVTVSENCTDRSAQTFSLRKLESA